MTRTGAPDSTALGPESSAETNSADTLIPFGKYILLNRICSGSTSAVYRAIQAGSTEEALSTGDASIQQLVALKRILPEMSGDPEFFEAFVREAKTASRLDHANICPVFELGRVGESLYMTTEHIAGKDLGRVALALRTAGQRMPAVLAAWVMTRLCSALDYAHNLRSAQGDLAGLVHRDLSPANVLIGYEGEVKLIDFGVAKAVGRAEQTNIAALKKKLGYMSPEMVRGHAVDPRSDIFGLGVLLYEMLTERRLFSGTDDIATLRMVNEAEVPTLSSVATAVPQMLEAITLRALQRDPSKRYASAAEMGKALSEFLELEAPLFGSAQLKSFMGELFAAVHAQEDQALGQLLKASQNTSLVAARKRFFSSPFGAAAVARAEITRRLVTGTPDAPVPVGSPYAAAQTLSSGAPGTDEELDEPTEIFDLAAPNDALRLGPSHTSHSFQPPPTAPTRSPHRRPNPVPQPPRSPLPPDPNAQSARRTRRTTMLDGRQERSVRNERIANYMLIAGVFLLSLSVVGVVLRTPLGEKLGLRPGPNGALEVRTTPDLAAAVQLDDVYRGQTPLHLETVREGAHTVTVRAKGFEPVSRRVIVTRGRTSTFEVDMSAKPNESLPH